MSDVAAAPAVPAAALALPAGRFGAERAVALYALPIAAGLVSDTLLGAVDTAIVGRLHETALAGVNVVANVVLGLSAVWLGRLAAYWIWG